MQEHKLYDFLQNQILSLVVWSLFTALAYMLLGNIFTTVVVSLGLLGFLFYVSNNAYTDVTSNEAKISGHQSIKNFNEDILKIENTLEMERKLYFALEYNEIDIYFQAQVNINKKIVGCEVLARWYNPDLGMVEPIEFIKIAEKTGIIIELGNYILEKSFKTLNKWETKGSTLEQFSINISVKQMLDKSFVEQVKFLCQKYLSPTSQKKVVFEINETLLLEDIEKIILVMKKIQKLGIRFSLDNFGTGYSTLNYLREIPLNELKIDRAFIKRLGENKKDEIMLETIFTLADIFDLRIVAEGIETETQFKTLSHYNCHLFQGYYFYMPLNTDEFEMKLFNEKIKIKPIKRYENITINHGKVG